MPTFTCSCGEKILIVPDLRAMDKAIKEHLIKHKKTTGKRLTESVLSKKIMEVLVQEL